MTEKRKAEVIYPAPQPVELGAVGPMLLMQMNARNVPILVTQGGKPVGYYAPFNGDVESFRGPQAAHHE